MSDGKILYERIIVYLKDQIENNILKEGDKLPSEKELSEKFGVSRITSKRALEELKCQGLIYRKQGSGSYVSRRNYLSRHGMTSADGADFSKVISFIIPFDASQGGTSLILAGISKIVEKNGYFLSIFNCYNDLQKEKDLLKELYTKKVGGIIYYPISDSKNICLMNKLYLDNFPIVTIDQYFESVPISHVVSDNYNGAYNAVNYLIKRGHTNIAFMTDNLIEAATSVRNRYFGYCMALKDAGININEKITRNGDLGKAGRINKEKYYETVQLFLQEGATAVIAVNDYVASYFISCASDKGINVPGDISVIGFDDLAIASHLSITTVRQGFLEMGESAANFIFKLIRERKCAEQKCLIQMELIERDSVRSI